MKVNTSGWTLALVGEGQKIVHQAHVLFVGERNARRLLRQLHVGIHLLAGFLNPPLNFANVLQILADLDAILRSQLGLQTGSFLCHRVQNAAVAFDTGQAVCRAAALPEHCLEYFARVDLHWQGRGRRSPGERVHVNAAVIAVASADQAGVIFDRQFHRRQNVILPDGQRRDLIRGYAGERVRALRWLGAHAAQPGCRAERMDRSGIGRAMSQAADDIQPVAVGLQRLQDRREFESRAFCGRRPFVHDRAVRHVDESKTRHRGGRGLPGQGLRRNHGIEQREGQGDAHPA